MKPVYIYVLKCPESDAVRYVGKTKNMKSRMRQHMHEANRFAKNNHKANWILNLLRRGLRPVMELDVEVFPDQCWKTVERERVAFYRALGFDLTNGTEGGDEPSELTAEGRRILSERASKIFGSEEGRRRQSEQMKRHCADPIYLAARTRASKVTRATPEYKAQQSERSKAMWNDPEFRARMQQSRAVLNASLEFRKKLSDSLRKAQADPSIRAMKAEKARAAWANPDIRHRQSQAIRDAWQRKERVALIQESACQ